MIDNLIKAATCRTICGAVQGSGHLIADGKVLTARHCILSAIDSALPIELVFQNETDDLRVTATILDQSADLDACILSVNHSFSFPRIRLSKVPPREGTEWISFGFPTSKTTVGHRISGIIEQTLSAPRLKIDIDLSINPATQLHAYEGLSGAPLINEGCNRGMIRLKLDGTIAAISISSLSEFLEKNGIACEEDASRDDIESDTSLALAERTEFQQSFDLLLQENSGAYVFLEGAHGIGKTTFCAHYAPSDASILNLGTYSFTSAGKNLSTIYRADPDVFYDWLSTTISGAMTGKPSRKIQGQNYSTVATETQAILKNFSDFCQSSGQKGLFFLDGLNEVRDLNPELFSKFIGLLPSKLPSQVTVVLTAPNFNILAPQLAGIVKPSQLISLPPLDEQACLAYCWQELNESKATNPLVERIYEKSKGHPLYLRYLIEYANSTISDDLLDDFPILSGPIEDYYETIWSKTLTDADAVNLLAIMARLRWGIALNDMLKALDTREQGVFSTVVSRIRHLLLGPDSTSIYHRSFTVFLLEKTSGLDAPVHKRIAAFCISEPAITYCKLNVTYHCLRSGGTGKQEAVRTCNQLWVDDCVNLGVEPDLLLSDIDSTLSASLELESVTEVLRILLLLQRVSFRYNTLFAQSASLMAEALIALKRPREALNHAIRLGTLIVGPDESLHIAYILIEHGYGEHAITLLKLLRQRILAALKTEGLDFSTFIRLCKFLVQTLFFMRMADGVGRMEDMMRVIDYARRVIGKVLAAEPTMRNQAMRQVMSLTTAYFLSFRDTYPGLADVRSRLQELKQDVPPEFLMQVIVALFECEQMLSTYGIPRQLTSLSHVFSDIAELINSGSPIDSEMVHLFVDTLVQLGAPTDLVALVARNETKAHPTTIVDIRAHNEVDVDFRVIHSHEMRWTTNAFLDATLACPVVGFLDETGWYPAFQYLLAALFWCDGKARRAKAEHNDSLRQACWHTLNEAVLEPLAFSLAQRVSWSDSYGIPETLVPFVYDRIARLLVECFPEEIPVFLENLSDRMADQCGLYSEGFRGVMFRTISRFLQAQDNAAFSVPLLIILNQWKEHVIRGVENRHELVPELLALIPLYVKVGATEEAERLYKHLLGVSMGPSWYKEDQLGLMVSVLRNMPDEDEISARLPLIAGYLERASGEMTFQRFVRYEKSALIGELFRRGMIGAGIQYFERQSCGTLVELSTEIQLRTTDMPNPGRGMRYPGGALDEQEAILMMVRNGEELDWRLRWALLEIFQLGDDRHLDDYATEYAKLINFFQNDAATISKMNDRLRLVVCAEIGPEEIQKFLIAFRKELVPALHEKFAEILTKLSAPLPQDVTQMGFHQSTAEPAPKAESNEDYDDGFYLPGTFGRRSVMKKAESLLEALEFQIRLGNFAVGKEKAVEILQLLQDGGWNIWGDLSASSKRAEDVLRENSTSASDVLRAYSSLIKAESYAPRWRIAEHLIIRIAALLEPDDRQSLLDCVIDHVRLMVGPAVAEIKAYAFLREGTAPKASSDEAFNFITWQSDHPEWLRRNRAAGLLAWIVDETGTFRKLAVKLAFSMGEGNAPELFCGILDRLSLQNPENLWDSLTVSVNLENVCTECRHVSRLAVLYRIAQRAASLGSSSAKEVAIAVSGLFRAGTIELPADEAAMFIPNWSRCVESELNALRELGLLTSEVQSTVTEIASKTCAPLTIDDAWMLERLVSTGFSQPPNKIFNRWEARVRFALNCALFRYASNRDFQQIESVLRIFNPSLPERTLTPNFNSLGNVILDAVSKGTNYGNVVENGESFLLNYVEILEGDENHEMQHIEVIAVLASSATNKRSFFLPSTSAFFRSRETPALELHGSTHETCWHLSPQLAFFGSFTPGFPLRSFAELVGAGDHDFSRVNWRLGRMTNMRYHGRPVREGCLLSVRKSAVIFPEGKKLAWIIRVNGEVVTMVDSNNNQLF